MLPSFSSILTLLFKNNSVYVISHTLFRPKLCDHFKIVNTSVHVDNLIRAQQPQRFWRDTNNSTQKN